MSAASSSMVGKQPYKQHKQHRKATVAIRRNRAKHGRMLSNRQDLKNLLVMRPPAMGQSQTWRYVYSPAPPGPMVATHQYFQRKMPALMPPMLKTRTVPLILHIRQRSDDWARLLVVNEVVAFALVVAFHIIININIIIVFTGDETCTNTFF